MDELSRDTWLSPTEAGHILGLSYHALRRWMEQGRLRVVRLPGGQLRISRGDIEDILRRGLREGGGVTLVCAERER